MPVIFSKLFDCCKLVGVYFREMIEIINPPRSGDIGYLKACKKRYKSAPRWYKLINEILVISSIGFAIYKFKNLQLKDITKYYITAHDLSGHTIKGNYADFCVKIGFNTDILVIEKSDIIITSALLSLPFMLYPFVPVLYPFIMGAYYSIENMNVEKIMEISAGCANEGCNKAFRCIKK